MAKRPIVSATSRPNGDAHADAPWMLAIDTATDQAGLALFDGQALFEVSWPGGRQQTTSVLPEIDRLLELAGIGIDAVGAIAVAAGPGSFTGLRVGLSIAKGLVTLQERALIGVNTLDLVAAPWREAGVSCVALIPAGRGRVVWSVYPAGEGATAPANVSFEDLLDALEAFPGWIVAGELTSEQRRVASERQIRLSSWAMSSRRPGVLAELGNRRLQTGETDDPVSLEPVYLHGQPNPR